MNLKKYNVYDAEEERYILNDVTMELLQMHFRCSKKKLSQYICEGYKLDKRYLIRNIDDNRNPDEIEIPMTLADRERITKEWNEIRTAVKLLKTGHGKMVTRNGRKCVVMK